MRKDKGTEGLEYTFQHSGVWESCRCLYVSWKAEEEGLGCVVCSHGRLRLRLASDTSVREGQVLECTFAQSCASLPRFVRSISIHPSTAQSSDLGEGLMLGRHLSLLALWSFNFVLRLIYFCV